MKFTCNRTSVICVLLMAVWFRLSEACDNVDGVNCRTKRQTQDVGNQIIDSIFKIPITTLTAVSDLIKSTRPVIKEVRRRTQEQYMQYQQNRRKTTTTVQYIDLRRTTPRPPPPPSRGSQSYAASVAGVYQRQRQQYDGSSYRI